MNILRLALAALTLTLASSAGTTIPALTLSCTPTPAGQSEPCTISSSGSQGLYVTFTTYDGTAKAGTDYTAVHQMVYLRSAPVTVNVPTMTNPNATGTLTFGAAITAGIGVVHAQGSIVEPAAPPPPPPAPQPAGWVLASSVTPIATPDFAFSQGVTAQGVIASNSNAPDVVGAERFICGPGHLLRDDPIVFPGQPGKSHLHQFYGNLSVNANSTYQSIRTSGNSTCSGPNFPLNRSGYWMPAMLDGQGNAIRPNYATVYYKRHPQSSVICSDSRYTGGCVAIPTGLKMIAGKDMLNMSSTAPNHYYWECTAANGSGATARDSAGNGTFPTMAQAIAICPNDGKWQLTVGLDFPECWDGVYIDSPDHRSHVAYAVGLSSPIGGLQCPISAKTGQRMKLMPVFRLFTGWTINAGDNTALWRASSDAMDPTKPAGWSFHADYMEGWDPQAKQEWTDNCIDRMASCTSGNLGGGHALTGAAFGSNGTISNRLIPLNTIP